LWTLAARVSSGALLLAASDNAYMNAPALHSAAQQGFSAEAQAYTRGRPEYPPELLPWLAQALALQAGNTVVDLGAGTGKFTKLLAQTGARVLAVEPVDAMRQQLTGSLPGVQALAGSAQAMPLPDGTADALVCAQAFHWFATEDALREMQRVLVPGGWLGLVWNVRDESVDWVAAITEIITPHEGDAPRFYKGDWRKPFAAGPQRFSPLELQTFAYTHVGSPRQVIMDRFLSVSFIAALAPDAKADVARQLQTLVDTHPALLGQDSIAFPYRTEAYRCRSLRYDYP
jgi:SAM-dependent methyltransferase